MSVSILSLSRFVFYVAIADLMAGGGGRWFTIGPISARMIIFGLCVFLIAVYLQSSDTKLRSVSIKTMTFIVAISTFYIVVALFYGATFSNIFSDFNFLLTLLYIPVFYVVLSSWRSIKSVNDYFVFLTLLLSVVTIGILAAYMSGFISLKGLGGIFESYGYGGNIGTFQGGMPRIFFISQVFLLLGLSILAFRLMHQARRGLFFQAVLLGIVLIALLVTNTRGLWLAAVLMFVAMGVLSKSSLKVFALASSVSLLGLMLLIGSGVFTLEALTKRTSTTNSGDLIRLLQASYVMEQFYDSPLIGQGFGLKLPEEYYIIRSELSHKGGEYLESTGVSIELTYLDMLRKFGVFGVALFAYFVIRLLLRSRKLLNDLKMINSNLYELLLCYSSFFVGFLVASATNPYLINASGAFVIAMMVALLLVISNKWMGLKEYLLGRK